jgi:hypothetical protein
MSKDTVSTFAGVLIAVVSTFQMYVPADASWIARAVLAAVAAGLGVWTGLKAYQPPAAR